MIVHISAGSVSVAEAEDRGRLNVHTGLDSPELTAELSATGLGRLAGARTVLLDIDALRDRARAGSDAADWAARWQAVIDYAGRRGWLSEDGRSVRAHLEGRP